VFCHATAPLARSGRLLAAVGVDVTYRLFVFSTIKVVAGTVAAMTEDVITKVLAELVRGPRCSRAGSTLQIGDARISLSMAALASALSSPGA
jgi:hypothetical protein